MQTRLSKSLQPCCICYEKISLKGDLLVCQHDFCFQCIKKWAERENSCPVCKRRFKIIKKERKRIFYTNKPQIKEQQTIEVQKRNQDSFSELSLLNILDNISLQSLFNQNDLIYLREFMDQVWH